MFQPQTQPLQGRKAIRGSHLLFEGKAHERGDTKRAVPMEESWSPSRKAKAAGVSHSWDS